MKKNLKIILLISSIVLFICLMFFGVKYYKFYGYVNSLKDNNYECGYISDYGYFNLMGDSFVCVKQFKDTFKANGSYSVSDVQIEVQFSEKKMPYIIHFLIPVADNHYQFSIIYDPRFLDCQYYGKINTCKDIDFSKLNTQNKSYKEISYVYNNFIKYYPKYKITSDDIDNSI